MTTDTEKRPSEPTSILAECEALGQQAANDHMDPLTARLVKLIAILRTVGIGWRGRDPAKQKRARNSFDGALRAYDAICAKITQQGIVQPFDMAGLRAAFIAAVANGADCTAPYNVAVESLVHWRPPAPQPTQAANARAANLAALAYPRWAAAMRALDARARRARRYAKPQVFTDTQNRILEELDGVPWKGEDLSKRLGLGNLATPVN